MKASKKDTAKRIGHIVNHTHWDREWRYPFWDTQLMLIDFMDELIALMENDTYEAFLMDGQVSPIIDYLKLRPEMQGRVKKLVFSGRLEIGPWYTLPDEYPVDGEALVRNLLWGKKLADSFGRTMKVGYTSFGWGQISQLPQIYKGFGIDVAFIGKRVNKERAPKSEFLWKGADGTELLTSRFGEWGRQNFYYYIHLPSLYGIDHFGKDWHCRYNEGVLYHRADQEQAEQDMFQLKAPDKFHSEMINADAVERTWQTTDESLLDSDRLMMNGCDYAAAQPLLTKMVEQMQNVDSDPDRIWVQTTLEDFSTLLLQKCSRDQLPIVTGELRDGPAAHVTGNALMTRNYLKRLNKQAQNLLIRFAEPLATVMAMHDLDYPQKMLDSAWDMLLQSHAHDSINGVVQDATADDVSSRLKSVIQISQAIGNRSMQAIIDNVDLSSFSDDDILIAVVNPLPYERTEILETWVDIPDEKETYEFIMPETKGIQILDAENNPVPTQWLGAHHRKYPVQELHTRAFPLYCKRHRVVFDAGRIPAGGYKIFRVGTLKDHCNKIQWADSLARTSDILKAPDILENEYLRVKMNQNGTFDLTDKGNDRVYKNLNYYEDHGEHGDYWANESPIINQIFNSIGSHARIWIKESGPLRSTIVSEVTMCLPQKGSKHLQSRGENSLPLVIQTSVTLCAGSRQVDIEVEFENRHEDHCLRVMLPTCLSNADSVDAGGHFTVVNRPVRPQGPDKSSYWPDMARLPFDGFVDISDGKHGFAIVNDSLTEYEVSYTDNRILALTLLRSVRNGICTELRAWSHYESQKGGQCLGSHRCRYAIKPHTGNWQKAQIDLNAQLFNAPVRLIQTNNHTGTTNGKSKSFFAITNDKIRFAAFKKSEFQDSYVVRIYNPTDAPQTTDLKWDVPIKKAWLTELSEERKDALNVSGASCQIAVDVAAQKIVTIEVEFETEAV